MTAKAPAMVYLGLGTNLGDRAENLRQALSLLGEKVRIERTSAFYDTEPVGYVDQPRFLNAACRGQTGLNPEQLFRFVKRIESGMGRAPTFRNGPRIIDIDILFYDDLVLSTPMLEIPHPRLAERVFVLAPLAEIAPDFVHPVLKQSMAELLRKCNRETGSAGEIRPHVA